MIIQWETLMPTVLLVGGLRFYFYTKDHRPIHVHVERGRNGPTAKIELEPAITIVSVNGFSRGDIKKILNFCNEAREDFIAAWEDYFEDDEDHK